jgi:hypothetical protein
MKTNVMTTGAVLSYLGGVLLAGVAGADILETKAGELVEGTYLGGTQHSVRFQVGDQLRMFPVAELLALTFTGAPGAGPASAAPPTAEEEPTTTEPNEPAAPAPSIIVPAATRLMVRLDQTLDSSRHGAGHMFTASLEADLIVGGKRLAPRGSKVYGRLIRSRQGGRLAGKSELGVMLTDVTINGRPHAIETTAVRAVAQGAGGNTVRNVGVGAGIGRLSKGTSKATKRGAAVGLGTSVLTSGSRVYIPARTLMEFSLTTDFEYVP